MNNAGLPVIGFAAYSGTGKTTLVNGVIPLLQSQGLRIGVIKHAHHSFSIDTPGKDSYEYRKAGAEQVLIASQQRVAWVIERDQGDEPDLKDLLKQFSNQPLDLVIVEGFKHEPFTKIEVHRSGLDQPLLAKEDQYVIAVATDAPQEIDLEIVTLSLEGYNEVAEFILENMRNNKLTRTGEEN